MTTKITVDEVRSVSSSNIASVGYDRDKGVLAIEFHNGTTVGYTAPEDVFEEMAKAESVGRYYNAFVRGYYKGLPPVSGGYEMELRKEDDVDIPVGNHHNFTISYVFEGSVDIQAANLDEALIKFAESAKGQAVKVKAVTINFED